MKDYINGLKFLIDGVSLTFWTYIKISMFNERTTYYTESYYMSMCNIILGFIDIFIVG